MADPIRIGVVGAHAERGWARWTHLPALSGLPGYTMTAVASPSTADAAKVWGARLAFADANELINHPDVDLVTIAIQLPRRDGLVAAAIRAGKHVYSEWPLAIDAPTAMSFRDAAAAAGVHAVAGLQSRHHPAIRLAASLIAEGRIGELLSASMTYSLPAPETTSARYTDLFDRTKGVNHLTIVGGHSLDMFQRIAGPFTELSATLATRIPTITVAETGETLTVTSPDQIAVTGILASGAAATAHIMTGGPAGEGFRFAFQGRAGRLTLTAADADLVSPQFSVRLDTGSGPTELPHDRLENPAVANVRQVYTDLATAIRAGIPSGPDFTDAVRVHRLPDAIIESASTGGRVTLD